MQEEVVARRGWVNQDEFQDLVGAANLFPGPASTQVAMALGYRRAGVAGLLLSGTGFILPGALATLLLAWLYQRYGMLPVTQSILYCARPALVAILVDAIYRLARKALRGWIAIALAILSLVAAWFVQQGVFILLGAGVLALVFYFIKSKGARMGAVTRSNSLLLIPLFAKVSLGAGAAGSLFLLFFKLGFTVFGSGYVLIAFLRAELVERLHLITGAQLYDAIAAGQLTPGPVFATATFIGYITQGWAGAAVATAGIFLPSFPMAVAISVFAGKLRRSAGASAFLAGVTVAAIALMAQVTLFMARSAVIDVGSALIAVTGLGLVLFTRMNSAWLFVGAVVLGVVRALLFHS
jgi:chromate transporter